LTLQLMSTEKKSIHCMRYLNFKCAVDFSTVPNELERNMLFDNKVLSTSESV